MKSSNCFILYLLSIFTIRDESARYNIYEIIKRIINATEQAIRKFKTSGDEFELNATSTHKEVQKATNDEQSTVVRILNAISPSLECSLCIVSAS